MILLKVQPHFVHACAESQVLVIFSRGKNLKNNIQFRKNRLKNYGKAREILTRGNHLQQKSKI